MISRRILLESAASSGLAYRAPAFAQALARQQVVRAGPGFDDITTLDPHFAVLSCCRSRPQ